MTETKKSAETQRWYPTPFSMLRDHLVAELIGRQRPGSFLEVGIGPGGGMIATLARLGYRGQGIDISNSAVEHARHFLPDLPDTISLTAKNFWEVQDSFDLVLALDFLEHFDDDRAVLEKFRSLTKPGGAIIFCVPAHEKKWDETDKWAGHFRRYEKQDLIKKLSDNGLKCELIWSFGFPLLNIATRVRNYLLAQQNRQKGYFEKHDQAQRTEQSGTTALEETKWSFFFNDFWIAPFKVLQKFFLRMDLGGSYIVKTTPKPLLHETKDIASRGA